MEDKDNLISLYNAEGKKINVSGTTLMRLQHPKGEWVSCVCLVCPKLGHEMLLSWVDMIRMSMIHNKWPFELVEKKKITATAAVTEIKPLNTPSKLRPPNTIEETENPVWPPEYIS